MSNSNNFTKNREEYRRWASDNPEKIFIFNQPSWLDSLVGEEGWTSAWVYKNKKPVSVLPYPVEFKMGFRRIRIPILTQRLQIWMDTAPESTKKITRTSNEFEYLGELISQIENNTPFHQLDITFYQNINNWIPFIQKNYLNTTRYTYILDLNQSIEQILSSAHKNIRNELKKEVNFEIKESEDIETHFSLCLKSFNRQKFNPPFDLKLIKNLFHKTRVYNKLWIAWLNGKAISSFFYLHDHNSGYGFMTGMDPEYRNLNATTHLYFEAIKWTKESLRLSSFDFLGSIHPSIEPARRAWGGDLIPYYRIYKTNSRLLKIYEFIKGIER